MIDSNWKNDYEQAILLGNIKKARQLVYDNASQIKLLKFFRGTMQQLNTTMEGNFWLSNAKFFNDPYDSLPLANMRSKLQYNRYDPQERELALKEYEEQVKSNTEAYTIQSSIFVTCLTETSVSNLHMWSYYADEHKGFCAEYSLQKLLDAGVDIFPVVYSDTWNRDRNSPEFNTQVALIKGIEWAHEREWRVVRVSPDDILENGLKCIAVMPDAIYVGCNDQEHIKDNWNLYRNLIKVFKDNQQVMNYVFDDNNKKICLNEVLDQCMQNIDNKIPVFSMTLNENSFGLRTVSVMY